MQRRHLRKRLHIHDQRLEAGILGHRDAVGNLLLARGGDENFLLFRVRGRRPDHLEIQVHLFERERDVLIGLALDLLLELVLAQTARNDDFFCDDRA